MNTYSPADARRLAERCLELTSAEEAECLVVSTASYLTRFAGNRIHQNVAEENLQVSIRAVLGKRVGVAGTNRMDDEGLAQCAAAAVEAARNAPEDEGFPGLPVGDELSGPDRTVQGTLDFDATRRADAARRMIAPSASRGLTAAGKVEVSASTVAVANTRGVRAAMPVTSSTASVLSMGADTGSGWADFAGLDAGDMDPDAMGDQAASVASLSREPHSLPAGAYTVLLAADAVGTLLDFMSYTGFSAKAVAEGSSFMTGRIGEQVLSERITVIDDAHAAGALGLTFDFEGVPKQPTVLVEDGVVLGPVTDSYWAARTAKPNTGHALPAPNSFGPMPLDLRLEPGDATEDDMLASVKRGIFVTRFHYMNVEDPVRALFTGMTRDGTFLIENGKLTKPVKNLRFTQSGVDAFANVLAVGRERRFAGDEGSPSFVPSLLVEGFNITGQTR